MNSCKFFAFFHNSTEITAWMSVAMVALSRCIILSNLGGSNVLSSQRNRVLVIIMLRVYGFLCNVPTALGVRKSLESNNVS